MKAARAIRAMGPQHARLKKGEHGVLMFAARTRFAAPAFPLEAVFDPTGAGDTFAGGFLGYLAGRPDRRRRGPAPRVIMGSTLASFCVEAFSLDRLAHAHPAEIDDRYRRFRELTCFETI